MRSVHRITYSTDWCTVYLMCVSVFGQNGVCARRHQQYRLVHCVSVVCCSMWAKWGLCTASPTVQTGALCIWCVFQYVGKVGSVHCITYSTDWCTVCLVCVSVCGQSGVCAPHHLQYRVVHCVSDVCFSMWAKWGLCTASRTGATSGYSMRAVLTAGPFTPMP